MRVCPIFPVLFPDLPVQGAVAFGLRPVAGDKAGLQAAVAAPSQQLLHPLFSQIHIRCCDHALFPADKLPNHRKHIGVCIAASLFAGPLGLDSDGHRDAGCLFQYGPNLLQAHLIRFFLPHVFLPGQPFRLHPQPFEIRILQPDGNQVEHIFRPGHPTEQQRVENVEGDDVIRRQSLGKCLRSFPAGEGGLAAWAKQQLFLIGGCRVCQVPAEQQDVLHVQPEQIQ